MKVFQLNSIYVDYHYLIIHTGADAPQVIMAPNRALACIESTQGSPETLTAQGQTVPFPQFCLINLHEDTHHA